MDNDTKIALDSVNKRIDRNEEDIKELRRTHEENIKELRSNDERNKELTTSLEKTVAVFAEKVDNYISSDRKKSEKEIANEKSQRIMNGVALWAGFYRFNPHRFVADYLNIKLKLFQKMI